jgi:chromosome segregation ATPase
MLQIAAIKKAKYSESGGGGSYSAGGGAGGGSTTSESKMPDTMAANEQQQAAMVERGLQAYLEDGARRWGSLEKYVRAIDRHVAKFPKIGVELTLANQRRLDAEMRMNEALLSLGEAKAARGALVSRAVSAERNVAVLQRRVDELERGGVVVGRVVERQQQAADHTNYSDLVARMQKAESTIQELRKTVKKLVRSRDAAIREVDELRALGEEYIQERDMLDKVTAEAIEAYRCVCLCCCIAFVL